MEIKFYKEWDGEIIAVIPEPQERLYVLIYAKTGQHAQATRHYISKLKKATAAEAKELKAELKAIGYTNF
jgi:hypothetical protein